MANEIVKMVAQKAKIAEPIAQIAVDTVLNMLKSKLPASVGGILDGFLSSKTTTTAKGGSPLGDIGNIAGALGGLLGKK